MDFVPICNIRAFFARNRRSLAAPQVDGGGLFFAGGFLRLCGSFLAQDHVLGLSDVRG
jgi:hypothetical protein